MKSPWLIIRIAVVVLIVLFFMIVLCGSINSYNKTALIKRLMTKNVATIYPSVSSQWASMFYWVTGHGEAPLKGVVFDGIYPSVDHCNIMSSSSMGIIPGVTLHNATMNADVIRRIANLNNIRYLHFEGCNILMSEEDYKAILRSSNYDYNNCTFSDRD